VCQWIEIWKLEVGARTKQLIEVEQSELDYFGPELQKTQ
jgi:hypothetical protein